MWACPICTFENFGGVECEMCETPKIVEERQHLVDENWSEDQEDEDFYEVQMKLEKRKISAPRSATRVERVMTVPQGLRVIRLQDQAKLSQALREVLDVFEKEVKGQIANNQHFFIQHPFPLHGSREANTPLFPFGSERLKTVCELVAETMQLLGVETSTRDEMISRANVIVREYRPNQHIAFHCDELECDSQVFGFILLNEHLDHRGLVFKRGEGNREVRYTVEEHPGTAFVMAHEARYNWKHGLPPVSARRISVTVRFFKKTVLAAFLKLQGSDVNEMKDAQSVNQTIVATSENPATLNTQTEKPALQAKQPSQKNKKSEAAARKADDNSSEFQEKQKKPHRRGPKKKVAPQSAEPEQATALVVHVGESVERPMPVEEFVEVKTKSKRPQLKSEQIAVTLAKNTNHNDCKPAVISKIVDFPLLQKTAHNKLRCQARRVFREGGQELLGGEQLQQDERLFISQGENYIGPGVRESTPEFDASKCLMSLPDVERQAQKWRSWNYPKLRFTETHGSSNPPGELVVSSTALGELVEKCYLSVPELRELIQALHPLGLAWRFRSELWDTGRLSAVTVVNDKGEWVEFKVEGQPALRGTKKRDGPLWALEGGLNNSGGLMSTQAKPVADVGPATVVGAVVPEATLLCETDGREGRNCFTMAIAAPSVLPTQ